MAVKRSRTRKVKRTIKNFLKRVQSTKKVKSVRSRIAEKKRQLKKLSMEYKRAIKSESKKLSR